MTGSVLDLLAESCLPKPNKSPKAPSDVSAAFAAFVVCDSGRDDGADAPTVDAKLVRLGDLGNGLGG